MQLPAVAGQTSVPGFDIPENKTARQFASREAPAGEPEWLIEVLLDR